MEKVLLLTLAISILFFVCKLVEMKYIEKQQKPLKFIIRDTIIVCGCTFLPLLMFFQFDVKLNEIFQLGETPNIPTQVFSDEPGF
tara:strand:- start:138 stop:392 length:255 start_codon:yes stop_codon:yes gene_type:complete